MPMMYPCKKCLENNWSYQKIYNWIKATCQNCSEEVEFEIKQKRKVLKAGDWCGKCDYPVVKREKKPKASDKKKAYYYTAYLWCEHCKAIYFLDEWKIFNEDVCKKNIEESIAYAQNN